MNEPKNYKQITRGWDNSATAKRIKKCGCLVGYKCSCRGGEAIDEVFDLVDEMNLRHGKKRH